MKRTITFVTVDDLSTNDVLLGVEQHGYVLVDLRVKLALERRAPLYVPSGMLDQDYPVVLLPDCGVKRSIIRSLVQRGLRVKRLPWDHALAGEDGAGILVSNGPGDPVRAEATIANLRAALTQDRPIFGVCLGNQLVALAAGARTYKLRYGHRGHNQPCREVGSPRCYITSQNHGYAVDDRALPDGWEVWFQNVNDQTNEGIRHVDKPFSTVQFHPEAAPGPQDTAFLFDRFPETLA